MSLNGVEFKWMVSETGANWEVTTSTKTSKVERVCIEIPVSSPSWVYMYTHALSLDAARELVVLHACVHVHAST